MNDCTLSTLHALDLISDHKVLSTTFWTNHNERVSFVKPGLGHSDISLNAHGQDNRWKILILKIFNLSLSHLLTCIDHPFLSFDVKVVHKKLCLISWSFTSKVENELSKFCSDIKHEVSSKTLDASKGELALASDFIHIAEGIVDDTNLGSLNNKVLLSCESPL